MRGGHVDVVSRSTVSGWAADAARPEHRLAILIRVNGVDLGEVVADRPRRDLEALGRYGDGRHGFLFSFPEPLSPALEHHVLVRFAEDGQNVPNGEQRVAAMVAPGPAPAPASQPAPATPAAQPFETELEPILVTAPGRSGTTLLMRLLARSPAIVAAELVPYELRLLSYHAASFHVLTSAADLEHSTHPDRLEGDGFHIGFNPFHNAQYAHAFRTGAPVRDYYDHYVPSRLTACMRDLVREFYTRLARDRGKPGARYFAEKGNNLHKPTRQFTRLLFGRVRELVIVRDPRDVLCSHMAYFSSPPEKAFTQLSHAARQLLAIRAEAREDIHILTYEAMVRGEPACYADLSAFLGTHIAPDRGEEGQDVFRRHGTSASPEASVERWRTHLPPELKARCASDWAAFFDAFGYSA